MPCSLSPSQKSPYRRPRFSRRIRDTPTVVPSPGVERAEASLGECCSRSPRGMKDIRETRGSKVSQLASYSNAKAASSFASPFASRFAQLPTKRTRYHVQPKYPGGTAIRHARTAPRGSKRMDSRRINKPRRQAGRLTFIYTVCRVQTRSW